MTKTSSIIRIVGYELEEEEAKAESIEMWYDRHRREWTLYPVDGNGYQIAEARYGFSKAEAIAIKHDLEEEYL